jgi:hypothetical protein
VEHEFIALTDVTPAAFVAPVDAPAVRVMQPARRAASETRTLSEKAKRALLGDGRYRPQPFPRAR